MSKRSVIGILIALVGSVLAWDLVLATDQREGNTISEIVRTAPRWLAFAVGTVVGHWFW